MLFSRSSIRSRLVGASVLAALVALGGIGAVAAQGEDEVSPTELTVGLGFIPSVQFAQFYLADEAGYYEEAGLEVAFQNRIDPELVTLLAQGAVDIGISDGTSLIPAVSQGIPVVYGATDAKAGAVDSLYHLLGDERLNHRCDVIAGVLAEPCGQILTEFFQRQRRLGKK